MIYDYIVIGGGISGAAAAYELAKFGSVLVLEREAMPGYHATGRSAALFTRNFGNRLASGICQASLDFLQNPPDDFANAPILKRRGHLFVQVKPDHALDVPYDKAALQKSFDTSRSESPITEISIDEAMAKCPLLKRDQIIAAGFEEAVFDIDVDVLQGGYLRSVKKQGGTVELNAGVHTIARKNHIWYINHTSGEARGRTIVNAAGPWAEDIAAKAGAQTMGLTVKRRTAIIVEAPSGVGISAMPAVDFKGTPAYLKPDAGRLMVSPGDQTPTQPQDAQPEEIDIAMAAHYATTYSHVQVKRVEHAWAGIRSYTPDGAPVVGYDATAPNFFWLAGQAGYGIMMAPSLARATASLIHSHSLPNDLTALGVTQQAIAPTRFSTS